MADAALAEKISALLPQTQCRQCGYDGCDPYAEAIASGDAEIDRCPPGGAAGIAKLSRLLGRAPLPLNPANGVEAPLRLAFIEEEFCIGCTLCIQACPVDAIVGAPKQMHTVVESLCTGCRLCVPPCPVDCIRMEPAPFDWSDSLAAAARRRFELQKLRLAADKLERTERLAAGARADSGMRGAESRDDGANSAARRKKAIIQAAIERARKLRSSS